jgi:hypothetical protein
MQMNRRVSKRQATMGLLSSMWDGKSVCIGVVEDISANGILVSQIPAHFDEDFHECFSIVHGPLQDLIVMVLPSWKADTKKEMYQLIGFEIVKPPANWEQFVSVTLETTGIYK